MVWTEGYFLVSSKHIAQWESIEIFPRSLDGQRNGQARICESSKVFSAGSVKLQLVFFPFVRILGLTSFARTHKFSVHEDKCLNDYVILCSRSVRLRGSFRERNEASCASPDTVSDLERFRNRRLWIVRIRCGR